MLKINLEQAAIDSDPIFGPLKETTRISLNTYY